MKKESDREEFVFWWLTTSVIKKKIFAMQNCKRFEPRSHFISRFSMIIRVNVVLYRTVVIDSD